MLKDVQKTAIMKEVIRVTTPIVARVRGDTISDIDAGDLVSGMFEVIYRNPRIRAWLRLWAYSKIDGLKIAARSSDTRIRWAIFFPDGPSGMFQVEGYLEEPPGGLSRRV